MAVASVQYKGKGQTTGTALTVGSTDGLATPTAGNLLVVSANSDSTVTITNIGTAWTAGPSVVDGNGAYFWWKFSQGTESTITCTPGTANVPIAASIAEYSGVASFDVSNSSTVSSTAGTSTTAVSVTTTAAGDLIVTAALTHSGLGNMTGGSWTNSFTNQITAASGGATSADCVTFFGDLIVAGAAGAYSTSASWTNNASDRQQLVMAFKPAAAAAAAPAPVLIGQAVPRSYNW